MVDFKKMLDQDNLAQQQGLIPTTNYPYSFRYFNPVQSQCFPFINEDTNMVVSANTSAGKTVCAEIVMDIILNKGKKVIYLSPLKALTQEKYGDWIKRFPEYKICILTGDYTLSVKKKDELSKANIIVMTSEMCDSRTRKMNTEHNNWLYEVGLIIVDETHIITMPERGHPVEAGIMRFTKINKDARVIFLSATMPNVDELGQWLTLLNGKVTRMIKSDWRPVELQIRYEEYQEYDDKGRKYYYNKIQALKKNLALDIVKSKNDEKFLVFVHDKNTGRSLIKLFEENGIYAEFHNADLDLEERLQREDEFKRKEGLNVLVSTSTLAWGRNLPARNVIIVGTQRGMNEVDQLDIIQMAGRAGRYGIDDAGFVFLIVPKGYSFHWRKVFKQPRNITSTLKNKEILAFHVLAEICIGEIKDKKSLLEWYSRSFAHLQSDNIFDNDVDDIVNDLFKMNMITCTDGIYRQTNLGRVSYMLYFTPYDIFNWYEAFRHIFYKCNKPNEYQISWALAYAPSFNLGYIPQALQDGCTAYRNGLIGNGIPVVEDGFLPVAYSIYHSLTDEKTDAQIEVYGRGLRSDINRITRVLQLIDAYHAHWGKSAFWNVLPYRIRYGIPEEMTVLVQLDGVGGKRAREMWKLGIKTLEDVVEKYDDMRKVFKGDLYYKIREQAKSILSK